MALTVLISLLLLAATGPSGDASTDVQQITAMLREQRYQAALDLTIRDLAAAPGDARLWTLQGLAHAGQGNDKDALAAYKHATQVNPDYLPAWQAEAQIEFRKHDPGCARTLDRILVLQPQNEVAHAMRAALAFGRQDCASVVHDYSASGAVIEKQATALTEYGQCLVQEGMRAQAIGVFTKAAALSPQSWEVHFNLAAAQLMDGHPADALITLQPVLNGASPAPQVLDLAASAYEQMGDTPHAVQSLRRAIEAAPDQSSFYLHFADLCLVHQSFPVGIAMLNAGLKRAPDAAPLYMARGILLVQSGQFGPAEADFDKAAQLDPKQDSSAVASGLAKLQQSNLDEALRITRGKVRQNGGDAYLNYLLAEILRQKGADAGSPEFAEALNAVQRALQLQPKFPLALDLLGLLYLRKGEAGQAAEQFRKVLALEPMNRSALYHLILVSRKTGDAQAVPALAKRLAAAKAAQQQNDDRTNRYVFVQPGANQ